MAIQSYREEKASIAQTIVVGQLAVPLIHKNGPFETGWEICHESSQQARALCLCLLFKLGHPNVYVISFINTPNNMGHLPHVLMCS